MKRISLTANLFLDEYIPKDMYLKYEKRPHILIGLIDRRLVMGDQQLRDYFGSVTINNWWNDGSRQWSGIRTPESPDYSPTSQHTFGRASDKLFTHAAAETVRQYIREHYLNLLITCVEDGVSWVHSDVRYNQSSELLIVKP
jgi:tRNA(His) 5'-end guanylyltransferase